MLYIPFPLKRCTKCGEYKAATKAQFSKDKRHVDGLGSQCRICRTKTTLAWEKNNPEKRQINNRRYYEKHTDKIREHARHWRTNHPTASRASDLRWRAKNAEKMRVASRLWERNNPEKRRDKDQRRRALKRRLPATFTVEDWRHALAYFNGACAYCGNGVSLFDINYTLHRDHFIPVTKGGGYTPDNIIPACQSCNFSKSNCDPTEWVLIRFGPRRAKAVLARIATYFESIRPTH